MKNKQKHCTKRNSRYNTFDELFGAIVIKDGSRIILLYEKTKIINNKLSKVINNKLSKIINNILSY